MSPIMSGRSQNTERQSSDQITQNNKVTDFLDNDKIRLPEKLKQVVEINRMLSDENRSLENEIKRLDLRLKEYNNALIAVVYEAQIVGGEGASIIDEGHPTRSNIWANIWANIRGGNRTINAGQEEIPQEDVHLEEIPQEDVHLEEVHLEDVHLEDVPQEDVHLEEVHLEYRHRSWLNPFNCCMRGKSQNGKSATSSDEIEKLKQEVETNRMLTKENCELKDKIAQLRLNIKEYKYKDDMTVKVKGFIPHAVCRFNDERTVNFDGGSVDINEHRSQYTWF